MFPPAIYEGCNFSTSLPLVVISLFDYSHSSACGGSVVSHMVLICISLMNNGDEYLFYVLIDHFLYWILLLIKSADKSKKKFSKCRMCFSVLRQLFRCGFSLPSVTCSDILLEHCTHKQFDLTLGCLSLSLSSKNTWRL